MLQISFAELIGKWRNLCLKRGKDALCRQLSTGAIVTLSLVGGAVMTFQREKLGKSAAKIRISLPPRSLQVFSLL